VRDEDRIRFYEAIKEILDVIVGQKNSKLDRLTDTQERWKDLLSEITTRTTGAGTPAFNVFNAPNRAYQFAVGDEVYNIIHVPHDWKPGTKVYFHVHWAGSNTDTGTTTWDLNWCYAPGHGQGAFSANALVQVTQAHCGIVNGHNIAEMSDEQAVFPVDMQPDGIFMVATKLSAKAYTGNVFGFYVDMHYQSDENMTTTRFPVNGIWTKNEDGHASAILRKINEILELLQ
jgi:hypothetical protein